MDLRPGVLCALGRALGICGHMAATPGTSWASSLRHAPGHTRASPGLLIIFLCQTFVSNFIPEEVAYFPFGGVCDPSK